MATFVKIPGARGVRHKAIVRLKGYPTSSKTFATRKLAQEWARNTEREIESGKANPDAAGRAKTFSQLVELHLRLDTGSDPNKVIRLAWWGREIGDRKLSEISRPTLLAARDKLRNERRPGGATRSAATVNRYLAAASAVMRTGVDEGWIAENPFRGIKRGQEPKGRQAWLRDYQREALLESVQHPDAPAWLHPLVVMALGTGARRGDLLGLSWRDVDLDKGCAYLARTKNDEPRVLVLLPPVLAVLRDWKAQIHVRNIGDDLVFPLPTGFRSLYKPWQEAKARAGIEDFNFHDLRHSCASYLAQAGVPQRTIMEAMGHKTLAASQRYMHLDTEHVAAALGAAMEGKL